MTSKHINLYRTALHPLLSVLIPFVFLLYLNSALSLISPAWFAAPEAMMAWTFLVGLAETAFGNMFYKEKIGGFLPRLRELIIIIPLSYLLLLLFTGRLFEGSIGINGVRDVYPVLIVLLQWLLSFFIHRKLRERELFLNNLVGKSGRELENVYRDLSTEAKISRDSIVSVKKLLRYLIGLGFVVFLVIRLFASSGADFPGKINLLFALHSLVSLFFIFILNTYIDNESLYGRGFDVPKEIQKKRSRQIVGLLVLTLLLALPAAGRRSLFPSEYLSNALAWVRDKTALPSIEFDVDSEATIGGTVDTALGQRRNQDTSAFVRRENTDREALYTLLRTIVIVLIFAVPALLFLVMIFKGAFSKESSGKKAIIEFFRDIFRQIKEAFAEMKKNFGGIFQSKNRENGGISAARSFFNRIKKRPEETKGGKKSGFFARLTLEKEIKAFLQVIKWGKKQGVPFRVSLGPLEYARMLSEKVPAAGEALRDTAQLLEVYLFSPAGFKNGQEEQYYKGVKEIVKTR